MGQLPAYVCACSRSAPVRAKQPSQNQHPVQARTGDLFTLAAAEKLSLAICSVGIVELPQFVERVILHEVLEACVRYS